MVNQRSFGRRVSAQPAPVQVQARAEVVPEKTAFDETPVEQILPQMAEPNELSIEQELEEWKRARKQAFRIPWRQLSWVASLCFGIASFALPASVNDNVQWVLYALMAASLYAGFSKRREKAKNRV